MTADERQQWVTWASLVAMVLIPACGLLLSYVGWDMTRRMGDLESTIHRLEIRLERSATISEVVADHESRLRRLERAGGHGGE